MIVRQSLFRRFATLAATMITAAMLGGCTIRTGHGTGSEEKLAGPPRELPENCKIGFLITLNHPYWHNMRLGAIDEGKKHGVTVDVLNAEEDPKKQIEQINQMIAQKVDAVCLAPMKKDALVPGVQALNRANIPVIIVNREIGEPCDYYCYVGTNVYGGAVVAARILMEAIGGEGKIVEFHQLLGTSPEKDRSRALQDVLKEYPKVKLVARLPHGAKEDLVNSQMFVLLDQHPDLKGVYAHGDVFAIAASQVCQDKKRTDVAIVGMGGSREAIKAIKEGRLTGTSFQQPEEEGRLAVRMAIEAVKRKKPSYPIECPAVTRENADQFEGQF